MKLTFKPFKKIFKKFKIILNFNYEDLEFQNKTNIKSILNQSAILESEDAEDYLNGMLEFFFYDFYNVLLLNEKQRVNAKNLYSNESNVLPSLIKNKKSIQNLIIFISKNLLNKSINCHAYDDGLFTLKKQKFYINKLIKKFDKVQFSKVGSLSEDGIEIHSEFKKINLQFPLYIYIYKKELKNLFLIFNLISSLLLKKYFFMLWELLYKQNNKVGKYLSFLNLIIKKYKLFNYKFYFFNKFHYPFLFVKWFFKLTLLKNFQYVYFNYFNYFNLKIIFNSLFGTFLSYYRHHEFKKRKINFRRKIRKNLLLENQYI